MSSWFENLWQIVFSKDVHSTIFSPPCSSKIDHQEAESIFPPPLTWVSSWLGCVIQSAQFPPDFPDMLAFEAQPLCCEQVHGSPRSACGWDPRSGLRQQPAPSSTVCMRIQEGTADDCSSHLQVFQPRSRLPVEQDKPSSPHSALCEFLTHRVHCPINGFLYHWPLR